MRGDEIGERVQAAPESEQRRQRRADAAGEIGGDAALAVAEAAARIGAVEIARIEPGHGSDEPIRVGGGTRAAQHHQFQRVGGACKRSRLQPEAGVRMAQQPDQRHRRQFVRRSVGDQPGEPAGDALGQRLAGGIVDRDAEAQQFRRDTASEIAVRRHQSRGLVRQSPASRARRWRW